jgi:hypothetical protein
MGGARALLLATLHRFGAVYVLEVRVLEPDSGRRILALTERAAREGLPELLDRVSARVRLAFSEDSDAIRERSVRLREAVTPSLAAWSHYFRGLDCFERLQFAGSFERCLAEFQQAARIDSSFALAHLQVSQLSFLQGLPRAAQQAALEPAVGNVDRIPPRDRLRVRGWAAFLGGDGVEAKRLLREAAEQARDDKLHWWLAGEIAFHSARALGAGGRARTFRRSSCTCRGS